jgi:hypothetical protein
VRRASRVWSDECVPIAAGDGWFATLDHMTATLALYDGEGRARALRRLDRLLRVGGPAILSIAGHGRVLAVGFDAGLVLLEVALPPPA